MALAGLLARMVRGLLPGERVVLEVLRHLRGLVAAHRAEAAAAAGGFHHLGQAAPDQMAAPIYG